MDIPFPTSYLEIIADGAIEQAAIDQAARPISDVECTGLDPADDNADAPCQVRLHPGPRTIPATRVARVRDDDWQWLTSRAANVDFADTPLPDDLLRVARTLFGNAPALLIPHSDSVSVVVLHEQPPAVPVPLALKAGLSTVPPGHLRRALAAFAAGRNLKVRESDSLVEFSDGTGVSLVDGVAIDIREGSTLSLPDIYADAVYISAEHQLLFEGRFPGAELSLDMAAARVRIQSHGQIIEAEAQVMGLLRNNQWVWAWADPRLNTTASAQAVRRVYDFGGAHLLPALTTPVIPWRPWLIDVCKPIASRWVHGFVHLPDAVAVVLIKHPDLALPPPTESTTEVTLGAPLAMDANQDRALAAYAQFRGLSASSVSRDSQPPAAG